MSNTLNTSFLELSRRIESNLSCLGEIELDVSLTEDLKDAENKLRSVVNQLDEIATYSSYLHTSSLVSEVNYLCDHGWGD